MVSMYIINHFTYQCHLLITFANSLDPVQARLYIGPDLYPNCCHSYGNPEVNFRKKKKDNSEKTQLMTKNHEKFPIIQS